MDMATKIDNLGGRAGRGSMRQGHYRWGCGGRHLARDMKASRAHLPFYVKVPNSSGPL